MAVRVFYAEEGGDGGAAGMDLAGGFLTHTRQALVDVMECLIENIWNGHGAHTFHARQQILPIQT